MCCKTHQHSSPLCPQLSEHVPRQTKEKDARNGYNSLCSVCWPNTGSHLITRGLRTGMVRDTNIAGHAAACLEMGHFCLVEHCCSKFRWPPLIKLQGWTNSYMHVWGLLTLLNKISKFLKEFSSFLARGSVIEGHNTNVSNLEMQSKVTVCLQNLK